MSRFWDVDFTAATAGPLADLTDPSYVNNPDLDNLEVVNAEGVHPTASAFRAWGPDVSPSTNGYRTSIYVQPNSGSSIAVLDRWNGTEWSSPGRKAYVWNFHMFLGIQLFRHVDDTGGVLLYEDDTFVTDNNIEDTDIIGLSIQSQETDSSTVTIDVWVDLGGGWLHQATVTDTSTDRITNSGLPGVRSYNVDSRVRSALAEDLLLEQEIFRDDFDNIAAGNTQDLDNRTDPYSYDGSTLNALQVVGTDNHLELYQLESNRLFGPVIDVPPDGYLTEMTGFRFAGTGANDNAEVLSRWDGLNFGSEAAYALRFRLADGWYLIRYEDHQTGPGSEVRLSDTNYVANNGIDANTVMSFRIKSEEVGTDTVINAWINHSGAWDHVVQDHLDGDAERISALGRPAYIMRLIGQTCESIRAFVEVDPVISIDSVTPGVIRDGDSFVLEGTFPNTVTDVDVDGAAQTISSQDGTSVTCTFSLGDTRYGSHVITAEDNTAETDSVVAFFDSVAGVEWETVDRLPWPDGQLSTFDGSTDTEFGTARDVQDGMQVEWTTPTSLGDNVEVYFDGVPEVFDDSGDHVFNVRVHDGNVWGPQAQFTVSSDLPNPPVADAGPDQTVNVDTVVQLDASGSTFPGGADDPAFNWTHVSGPSQPAIVDNDSSAATFTPDALGTYVLQVEAFDQYGQSDTDQVTIESVEPFTVALTTGTAHGVGVALNFGGSFVVGLTVGTAHGVGQTLDISTGAVNAVTVGTAHGVGQTLGVEAGTGVVLALAPGTAHGVGQALELEDSAVLALQVGTAHGTGQTLAARAGLSLALTAGTAHGTGIQLDFAGGLVAEITGGQAHGTGQTLAAANGQNLALQSGQAHGVGVALGTVLGDSVSFTVALTPGLAHGTGAALAANAGLSLALGNGVAHGTGQVLDVALANALALEVGTAHGSGQTLGLVTGDSVPFSVALQAGTAHGVGPQLATQVGIVAALQPGTAHGTGAALSLVTSDSVEYVEALVAGQAHGAGQQLQFTGGSRTAWLHGTAQGVGIELGSNLNHRFMVLAGQASGTGVDLATTTGNRIELGMGTAHGVGVDLDTFTGFILGHIANPSTRNISTTYSTREIQ